MKHKYKIEYSRRDKWVATHTIEAEDIGHLIRITNSGTLRGVPYRILEIDGQPHSELVLAN